MRNRLLIFLGVTLALVCISASVYAEKPYVWVDSSGTVTTKAKIDKYLDDLKAHSVTGIRVPVNSSDGAVFYKKSTLPISPKFKTGEWSGDDYLAYMVSQASKRDIKVIAKVSGANYPAWEKNTDWRCINSKGAVIGKAFCVNSPYWDKTFFPMVKEIAANYDAAGLHFDASQVAFPSSDACFCKACKARFEKETGKKLSAKAVDPKNWADPTVKLYAIKRTEWLNGFYAKYADTIHRVKPDVQVLFSVDSWGNSYANGISTRGIAQSASAIELKPTNIASLYEPPVTDEAPLVSTLIMPFLTPYGYHELMIKSMSGDAPGKSIIASDTYPSSIKRRTDIQIALIESAIGAGARGYCLSSALVESQSTAWRDPKFAAYLKDLTTGERAKWIDAMKPNQKVAILCDRDNEYWTGDTGGRLQSVGGTFAAIQLWKKISADLVSTSDPISSDTGKPRYKLDQSALSRYDIVICPGLDYISKEDIQTLKDYVDNGGKAILMGGIAGHGKFLGEPLTDEAFNILGITTIGKPEPSGFVLPAASNPVFMVPGGLTELMGSFRYSKDKNDAWTYKPKFNSGWEVLASEVTDSDKREAMLMRPLGKGTIGYMNTDVVSAFTREARIILDNLRVLITAQNPLVTPVSFSASASVNTYTSGDGSDLYIYVFTPEEEYDISFDVRPISGMRPVSAEYIKDGAKPLKMTLVQVGDPIPDGVAVGADGGATIQMSDFKPPFMILKLRYENEKAK